MRARSVWLAGITAVGVLLAGCADEEAPASLPEVSIAQTTMPPSTADDPTESPPNLNNIEVEVQRFYREYARLRFDSFRTADALEEQRQYFADSCDTCLRGYNNAEEVLGNGYVFDSEPAKTDTILVDAVEADVIVFNVVEDVPAAFIRDADGAVVKEYPETLDVQTLYRARRQPDGSLLIISAEVLGS
jgi:hypothetical protein